MEEIVRVNSTLNNNEPISTIQEKIIIPGHEGHAHSRVDPHATHEWDGFLVLMALFLVFGSQGVLVLWKNKDFKSFQRISLIGLWGFPILHSLWHGYYRMIFVWTLFTSITLYLIFVKAKEVPIAKGTPKWVYAWFFLVYRVSYASAVLGYIVIMLDIFQLLPGFTAAGILLVFYGLYFGVLGTDCAEVCTDKLAANMGFTGKGMATRSIAARTCCICNETYRDDESITLNCNHTFHQWCINGWTLIGKKNTCPFCSEKVEINRKNPWEKTGELWSQLLDLMRTLIVWNPIILYCVQSLVQWLHGPL